MKLSRLSDRQLRRLIRNADVRFGMNDFEEFASETRKAKSQVTQDFKMYISKILKILINRGILEKARREFDDFSKSREKMYDAWRALSSRVLEIEKQNK